jgi:N-sulfoglucosamine sulfohydrolase
LHRPKYELYDLEKDPGELNNLATDPAYKKTFEDLAGQLQTFQRRTKDPWLVKYEHE